MTELQNVNHPSECLSLLLNRYSMGIKHLVDPGPDDQQLHQIAQAALRAPDHGELVPFRLSVIRGTARDRLADLFEAYARAKGKSDESCAIERERAMRAPLSIAIIGRIDLHHPVVPAHEQWACIGGAIANILNAAHLMGFAGKMLSGERVRDQAIVSAFCLPGETLVGWVSIGTSSRALGTKHDKSVERILSFF
jgi:nitroreductase